MSTNYETALAMVNLNDASDVAQVYATLAVADELIALRVALTGYER